MKRRPRETGNRIKFSRYRNRDNEVHQPIEINNNEFQPKILQKVENSLNEVESHKKEENVKKLEQPEMKCSQSLFSRNHLDTSSLLKYMDFDNNNFYVIGVIGMKDSGKSTILNLIATGELVQPSLFNDLKNGNAIEAFITKNRIILLDTAPLLHNTSCRDFIVSEADDFRQLQVLFRLCHELLILYENHQLMNLLRMIFCANNSLNPYECEPVITLVENRVRLESPKNPITEIAKEVLKQNRISKVINTVQLQDISCVDNDEVVQKLRNDINIRKELKTYANPSETEKTWWEKFTKLETSGGFFINEYEKLREKYYQPNEFCN